MLRAGHKYTVQPLASVFNISVTIFRVVTFGN